MAYATLADVTARAGVLADAWPSSDVSYTDIETLLDQTAGELDAFLGGAGYVVPVDDPQAVEMLRPLNADFALELAIQATWPSDPPAQAAQVTARVDEYRQAMTDKNLGVLLYLGQTAAGTTRMGAADFWTNDAQALVWWDIYADRLAGPGQLGWYDPWGVPLYAGPQFRRGMRL